MSRNEAPAPDGQPTHQTRVIVTGLTHGSPEYIAAMSKHQGPLNHFISKNHQYVALSGLPVHKQSAEWGGATATYQNINGQTQVVLDLTAEYPEGDKSVDSDAYWRWAVIDIVIPGLTKSNAFFAAFLNPKAKNKVGAAQDPSFTYDFPNPPLAFALDSVSKFIEDFPATDLISSLRVDLRPYPGGVKFDLYAGIQQFIDHYKQGPVQAPVNYSALITAGNIGNSTHLDPPNQGLAWPSPGDVSGRTNRPLYYSYNLTSLTDVLTDFPALAPATGATSGSSMPSSGTVAGQFTQGPSYGGPSILWGSNPLPGGMNTTALIAAAGGQFTETTTYSADGLTKTVRGRGAIDYKSTNNTGSNLVRLYGTPPVQADGNWSIDLFDYTLYYVGSHPQVPVYGDATCKGPIRFAVMDDKPNSYSGHYLTGKWYGSQWEVAKIYPKRRTAKEFKDKATFRMIPQPQLVGIENHYGLTKIGTVAINPKKGKGGIKFTPA